MYWMYIANSSLVQGWDKLRVTAFQYKCVHKQETAISRNDNPAISKRTINISTLCILKIINVVFKKKSQKPAFCNNCWTAVPSHVVSSCVYLEICGGGHWQYWRWPKVCVNSFFQQTCSFFSRGNQSWLAQILLLHAKQRLEQIWEKGRTFW